MTDDQLNLFDLPMLRPAEPVLRPAPPLGEPPEYPSGIPPEVCTLFERLSLEISGRGFERYSADAILHRIRWHYQIERDMRDFKCNNNWTATLARWFLGRHPTMTGFFELRRSPHGDDE